MRRENRSSNITTLNNFRRRTQRFSGLGDALGRHCLRGHGDRILGLVGRQQQEQTSDAHAAIALAAISPGRKTRRRPWASRQTSQTIPALAHRQAQVAGGVAAIGADHRTNGALGEASNFQRCGWRAVCADAIDATANASATDNRRTM